MEKLAYLRRLLDPRHRARRLEAATERHGGEIDTGTGVTRLHAGLAVMGVIEDDDDEIVRLLDADGGEAADAHEHVAVARDRDDAAAGLRQSKPKRDHRGAAHRAPQIEIQRMVAGRGNVISGGAKPGYDQKIVAVDEDLPHEIAPLKHYFVHCLRPISRCESRIAI